MLNNTELDGSKPFGETRPWAQVVIRHAAHVQDYDSRYGWRKYVGPFYLSKRYRLSPEHPHQFERTFQSWPTKMQQALKDAYEDGCEIVGLHGNPQAPYWAVDNIYLPGDKYEPKHEGLLPCPFCGGEARFFGFDVVRCFICDYQVTQETWCRRAGKETER